MEVGEKLDFLRRFTFFETQANDDAFLGTPYCLYVVVVFVPRPSELEEEKVAVVSLYPGIVKTEKMDNLMTKTPEDFVEKASESDAMHIMKTGRGAEAAGME